jgi:hypothetical protein
MPVRALLQACLAGHIMTCFTAAAATAAAADVEEVLLVSAA